MVDKRARLQAGELLRHYAAGQITNDQFEDHFPAGCPDVAVREVRSAAWYLYDDLRQSRFVGTDRLSTDARREIARWVVFLHTNLEYEWPVRRRLTTSVLTVANLFTLGLAGRLLRSRFRRHGDFDVWPFIRRADYDNALATPRLLGRAV